MSKTIMAVGAHTGDAQLTCGMLLAKHAMAGDRVILVDLTAGERGTPNYEALSIVRGARIGVDHATCFGTSPTAKRQRLDLL